MNSFASACTLTPDSFDKSVSPHSIGASEGTSLVTVWPSFLSHLYPSPVEPYTGADLPPTAITRSDEYRVHLRALADLPWLLASPMETDVTNSVLSESYDTSSAVTPVYTFTPSCFSLNSSSSETSAADSDTG